MLNVRVIAIQAACGMAVALFSHGERNHVNAGISEGSEQLGIAVFGCGSDDSGYGTYDAMFCAGRCPGVDGVQSVLWRKLIFCRCAAQAGAYDAPVAAFLVQHFIGIQCLMCPVKISDADVQDTGTKGSAIVMRPGDSAQLRKQRLIEPGRSHCRRYADRARPQASSLASSWASASRRR